MNITRRGFLAGLIGIACGGGTIAAASPAPRHMTRKCIYVLNTTGAPLADVISMKFKMVNMVAVGIDVDGRIMPVNHLSYLRQRGR